jgi:hypothetical protein
MTATPQVEPPAWLGHTPKADELERMPLPRFHNVVDQLLAETVPYSYWLKVAGRRQATAWEVR